MFTASVSPVEYERENIYPVLLAAFKVWTCCLHQPVDEAGVNRLTTGKPWQPWPRRTELCPMCSLIFGVKRIVHSPSNPIFKSFLLCRKQRRNGTPLTQRCLNNILWLWLGDHLNVIYVNICMGFSGNLDISLCF